jgi:hypothetical protein
MATESPPYHWSQELYTPVEPLPEGTYGWSKASEPWKGMLEASLRVWVSGMRVTSGDAIRDLQNLRDKVKDVAMEMNPEVFLNIRAELDLLEKIFREGQIRDPRTKQARQELAQQLLNPAPIMHR